MQNAAVAQVFQEIADWMEVAGENVFQDSRVSRAAEAVAVYPEPSRTPVTPEPWRRLKD
jgi:DNA polymerase/3'-5' exonuclease PolX